MQISADIVDDGGMMIKDAYSLVVAASLLLVYVQVVEMKKGNHWGSLAN